MSNHWDGKKNKAIRYYFYCQRGLSLVNEFRYLGMAIFGIYFAAKLTCPWLMAVMFLVAIPILVVAGYLQVNHMAPVINWLDVTYGSYWSKKSMEWQERQVKATEAIRECVEHPRVYIDPKDWKPTVREAYITPAAPIADSGINAVAHEASGPGYIFENGNKPKKEDTSWMIE